MKDETNPVSHAAHWSKRNMVAFVFCLLSPALLWCGYSRTSATCCCPLLQQCVVLPASVSCYSIGDEHRSEIYVGVLAQISEPQSSRKCQMKWTGIRLAHHKHCKHTNSLQLVLLVLVDYGIVRAKSIAFWRQYDKKRITPKRLQRLVRRWFYNILQATQ